MVKNDKEDSSVTLIIMGWRISIDYRNLNKATRKDHFPLPFVNHMLERLAKHLHFCYLNSYSGSFQIPIHSSDQEKTTFMCPYVKFSYQQIPFGMSNTPAMFQRCMITIFAYFL